MDESFLEGALCCRIWLSCKSDKSLRELVSFKGFEACDNDIDAHIVLVTSEQVGFGEVLLDQVAMPLADCLLSSNNTDTTTTARSRWFHYVHVPEVRSLTFLVPAFVVFREQVSWWTDLEFPTMASSLPLHISPQISFVPNIPCTSEMVDLLKLVHVLQL